MARLPQTSRRSSTVGTVSANCQSPATIPRQRAAGIAIHQEASKSLGGLQRCFKLLRGLNRWGFDTVEIGSQFSKPCNTSKTGSLGIRCFVGVYEALCRVCNATPGPSRIQALVWAMAMI